MLPRKKTTKKKSTRKSTVKKKPVSARRTTPARTVQKQPISRKSKKEFSVVGIGTSAGGLEALQGFFSTMPSDNGMAFVIIQHLDPTRKSQMSNILQKHTQMMVSEIKDGMKVVRNRVYINPPNRDVALIQNTFQLLKPPNGQRLSLPIDSFFRSLAEDQRDRSIGVILSGSGSDGSQGLRAIRDKGGLVLVQDPQQAKYNRMPQAALNTDMVDRVLPVEKIPNELIDYTSHPYIKPYLKPAAKEQTFNIQLQKILVLIRSHTGHDFSHYKHTTLRRRIERRMALNRLDKISNYINYLQRTPEEVSNLFKDILITVTHFFRDPEAYKTLAEKVIPKLLKRDKMRSVRVWIPGCSTGEEAYSLAIIFQEALKKMKKSLDINIFATDISKEVIEHARRGVYSESIVVDVSANRLKRFFTKEGESFRVHNIIRKMVIFATQDISNDPPFTNLDLITCRNLLIYMEKYLQEKVLSLFHYTLKPSGYLFLGTSESLGRASDLFEPIDARQKIYKKKSDVEIKPVEYLKRISRIDFHPLSADKRESGFNEAYIHGMADKLVLEHYALPCVLINQNYDILYFHGKTDKYLSPPVGGACLNILKMIHGDLHQPLSSLLYASAKEKKEMVKKGLALTHNKKPLTVDLAVRPFIENKTGQLLMMVVFDDRSHLKEAEKTRRKKEGAISARTRELEQELQSTREYLQASLEEQETTNEELKSTNEELQSTNEELQSTNEELSTVNAELQNKIDELFRANDDLNNLFASTDVGVIFLDEDLHIQRFSPNATRFCNLIESDIGRPISDITFKIDIDNFHEEIQKVFKTLKKKDFYIKLHNALYLLRILPYRTSENIIAGVVITFAEITSIKDILSSQRLATVVSDSNDAITVHDMKGRIMNWNKAAERIYGYTEAEALQMNIFDIIPQDKQAGYKTLIKRIQTGNKHPSHQTERVAKDGRTINVWLTITQLKDETGNINAIATTERDLNELERLIDRNKDNKKR